MTVYERERILEVCTSRDWKVKERWSSVESILTFDRVDEATEYFQK